MNKVTWADIDEEEGLKEEQNKVYVPPHKKESDAINKKTKLPHTPKPKKP